MGQGGPGERERRGADRENHRLYLGTPRTIASRSCRRTPNPGVSEQRQRAPVARNSAAAGVVEDVHAGVVVAVDAPSFASPPEMPEPAVACDPGTRLVTHNVAIIASVTTCIGVRKRRRPCVWECEPKRPAGVVIA